MGSERAGGDQWKGGRGARLRQAPQQPCGSASRPGRAARAVHGGPAHQSPPCTAPSTTPASAPTAADVSAAGRASTTAAPSCGARAASGCRAGPEDARRPIFPATLSHRLCRALTIGRCFMAGQRQHMAQQGMRRACLSASVTTGSARLHASQTEQSSADHTPPLQFKRSARRPRREAQPRAVAPAAREPWLRTWRIMA